MSIMKKSKRILGLLLACVLCFATVTPVKADKLSDAKAKQKELEAQMKEAKAKRDKLAANLEKVTAKMEETKNKLDAKKIEIIEAQDELDQARIDESRQYDSMKKRIKYMYENGNTEFIEILCESESIGDLLNKAEYIKKISEYDRQMLTRFQNVVKQVEEKEARLKEEEAELNQLQDELIKDQKTVESMLAEAKTDVSDLDSKMGANARKIKELIAQAEEERRQQQEANKRPGNGSGNAGGSSGGGKPGAGQVIGNGQLSWPTSSRRVTSGYGPRPIPVAGATSWHDAIDIGAPIGAPVYAADSGRVITAQYGYNGGRGIYVMVDHGNGMVTRYQHLSAIYVSVGQKVSRGQNIAAVGNTGASSGPHLDFAVYVNGSTVNPMRFF